MRMPKIRRWLAVVLIGGWVGVCLPASAEEDDGLVVLAAGDIAVCNLPGDEATAAILDEQVKQHPNAIVLALGDTVYPDGTAEDFQNCYAPTWGRHKKRTYPTVGNHEYVTRGAQGYFDYFGFRAAPEGLSYYAVRKGDWLLIALNSNIDGRIESYQGEWLKKTLQDHPTTCALAFWHHPLFSSHEQRDRPRDLGAFWQILYEAGAELVLNGHIHIYERFAPLTPDGKRDDPRGMIQFTVGTGGASLNKPPKRIDPRSEALFMESWGVLKLTLFADRYTWEFLPTGGVTFRDSGEAKCHP